MGYDDMIQEKNFKREKHWAKEGHLNPTNVLGKRKETSEENWKRVVRETEGEKLVLWKPRK